MKNALHEQLRQRDPKEIMTLSRLGSFHASRLSFMRILLRHLYQQSWQFSCRTFELDENGEGYAVYTAKGPEHCYSLVAFAHDLPDEERTDRVIAKAWDCTFALFDGIANQQDIIRLKANVPLQEAGRISAQELSLSRANRSLRLWQYVVDCLASGRQPEAQDIAKSGYLMRTTAVYGSGKFGAADREAIADRVEFWEPFQVEMLHVYLIRWFVRDLVNEMAKRKGGEKAVTLSQPISRQLGIGNSTGLGMAPFLVNHPELLNNWIDTREKALLKVREVAHASTAEVDVFLQVFNAALTNVQYWQSAHPVQAQKLQILKHDLQLLSSHLSGFNWRADFPWQQLFVFAKQHLAEDAQEWLYSLMLEPYAALVDALTSKLSVDQTMTRIDGALSVSQIRDKIQSNYPIALAINWQQPSQHARVWYISQEKLEPRLGERFEEPLDEYEQFLCTGKKIAQLYHHSADYAHLNVAEYLLRFPKMRDALKRVLRLDVYPYAEIHDNLLASDMLPIDMLRCKLSFFGATQFDPRSDRWVRIVMFQHAPYPDELTQQNYDFWPYQLSQEVT